MKGRPRKRTRTSSFGTSGRSSHDSSSFYKSRLYQEMKKESVRQGDAEQAIPPKILDTVIQATSEHMSELPDSSVHLMITSPPYNVSKEYDENFTLEEYRALLTDVFRETFRVLVPGGRACINVANVGRKPYIPLHAFIAEDMISLGYLMRGEIIWNKGSSAGASTAWGSWRSASNPSLRDIHEYILVFSKSDFSRNGLNRKNTISRDDFLELTKSIWTFPAESARRIGHPAPFPVTLPKRLIQMYSFEGDTILDPFVGSGTTCVAAMEAHRHFVAYEKDDRYVSLANKRILACRERLKK